MENYLERIYRSIKIMQLEYLFGQEWDIQEICVILKKQFYVLAFQFHPDRNADGKEKFQEIQLAYEILMDFSQNSSDIFVKFLLGNSRKKREERVYRVYKSACINYFTALEKYFQKAGQVDLSNSVPSVKALLKALYAVKEQFAWVLQEDPGGVWAQDSIDKITRINIWLDQ